MQSTAFEKIGKLFASIFSPERMESFNDQFTKLLDLLLVGDFGGFWDEFIKGIQPAFKKLLENIEPAFVRAVDDTFGEDSKIGSWMKGLFDPETLTENLDKIIIGFIAFKMGIMNIITPLLLAFSHLALGLTKLVGNIGWEALKGTGRQLGRGIFGMQYKKDGPRVGGLFGKGGGMGGKAWKGKTMKMGGALALASVAEAAIEVGVAFSQASKEMDPVKRAKDTRKAWSKGVGAVVGGAVGAFFGPVGVAVGVQAGKYVGGWMSDMGVFKSEIEKAQQKSQAAQIETQLVMHKFTENMTAKMTTGLDTILGDGGKWAQIIDKAGDTSQLSSDQFTELAADLREADIPGVTKTAIDGVIQKLKDGTLGENGIQGIYEALALAAKENITKATEGVADFANSLSKKLGLDKVNEQQEAITAGIENIIKDAERYESYFDEKALMGRAQEKADLTDESGILTLMKNLKDYSAVHDFDGKQSKIIMEGAGFKTIMGLMSSETGIGEKDPLYAGLEQALMKSLANEQAWEVGLAGGFGKIDGDDITDAMVAAIQSAQNVLGTEGFDITRNIQKIQQGMVEMMEQQNINDPKVAEATQNLITQLVGQGMETSDIINTIKALMVNPENNTLGGGDEARRILNDKFSKTHTAGTDPGWDNPATKNITENTRDSFIESLSKANDDQTETLNYILKELVSQRINGIGIFKQ
jgi:hypothetical protein